MKPNSPDQPLGRAHWAWLGILTLTGAASFSIGQITARDDEALAKGVRAQEAAVRAFSSRLGELSQSLDRSTRATRATETALREQRTRPYGDAVPSASGAEQDAAVEAAASDESGGVGEHEEEARGDEVLTPDVTAKVSSALQVVDEAVRLGRWSKADGQKLEGSLLGLDSESRQQIFRRLVQQVNAGKVRPEEGAFPLM